MKLRTWISMTAVYLSVTLTITVQTSAKITTFNVKGRRHRRRPGHHSHRHQCEGFDRGILH